MPEVIEVLTYLDFLKKKIKGETIQSMKILKGRYKTHGPFDHFTSLQKALPLRVSDIQTKGKFLYITFENGMVLLSTLGLSGGWIWSHGSDYEFASLREILPKGELDAYHTTALHHLNVEFKTAHGILYFYDILSFGTLKVALDLEEVEKKLQTIGPDITTVKWEEFEERIDHVSEDKVIGNVLMNQRVVSGIGNYLRADILWLAKLSPFRTLGSLSTAELKRVWKFARFLVWAKYDYKQGIRIGAIAEKHPRLPSDYERDFYIFRQDTDPQGRLVEHKKLYEGSQERTIFWVPSVQH